MIKFKEQLFEKLVKATQEELLHNILIEELNNRGMENYIHTNDYLFVKGEMPVLLVAHLDTVHLTLTYFVGAFHTQILLGTFDIPSFIGIAIYLGAGIFATCKLFGKRELDF